MSASQYNHAGVDNATNPSAQGYHHGPIINNNPGWVPARQAAAIANGTRPPSVSVGDNANPPRQPNHMATLNTGVCDIDTGHGILCGQIFSGQLTGASLRRHIRNVHPGALSNSGSSNVDQAHQILGQNAIKLFVRSGAWRAMNYLNEPGRGPPGGPIDIYATEMEAIAANDAGFAALYGTRFHRRYVPISPQTPKKRKRGPSPPTRSRSPSPSARAAPSAPKKPKGNNDKSSGPRLLDHRRRV